MRALYGTKTRQLIFLSYSLRAEHKGVLEIMTINQFPMLKALHSDGPAQVRSEKMMLYGQFIGSWEGDIVVHLSGGE
jgi:hypothetical protein